MKAKSRKRLLISSVAMLLVAMLALGTATFAWFTTNPNANAEGLQLKASASKGLVIQTETHKAVEADAWAHTDYFNYDSTSGKSSTTSIALTPVSFNPTASMTTAYTVEAASDEEYDAASDAAITSVTASDNYFYQEKVYCKLTGGESSATLTMKSLTVSLASGATITQKAGIRVAVEYKGDLIGVYAPTVKDDAVVLTETIAEADDDTAQDYNQKGYKAATKGEYDFAAFTSAANTTLGTVSDAGTDYVTVTVYLDGEDATVFSRSIKADDLVTKVDLSMQVS